MLSVQAAEAEAPAGQEEADEVGLLRERVRQLTLEREQLQQQVTSIAGPAPLDRADTGMTASHAPVVTRLVQLARERACPLFAGRPAEDTLTIEAWITEVHKCWEGKELTGSEQVVFIIDHLIGNAKAEVEFHPTSTRETPEQVFALLTEHFRSPHSYIHSLAQFSQRHQRTGESVRQFSYALKELMDTVNRAAPGVVPNGGKILRDHFIEHVRDQALRRMLDQRISSDPTLDFLQVRALAVHWDEARPGRARLRSRSCGAVEPGPPPVVSQAVRTLEGALASRPPAPADALPPEPGDTQRQLAELTRLITQLVGRLDMGASGPRGSTVPRAGRTLDGRTICFRCNEPGHIARYCQQPPGPERVEPPSRPPPRPESRGRDPPLPAYAREVQCPEAGNAHPLPGLVPGLGGSLDQLHP